MKKSLFIVLIFVSNAVFSQSIFNVGSPIIGIYYTPIVPFFGEGLVTGPAVYEALSSNYDVEKAYCSSLSAKMILPVTDYNEITFGLGYVNRRQKYIPIFPEKSDYTFNEASDTLFGLVEDGRFAEILGEFKGHLYKTSSEGLSLFFTFGGGLSFKLKHYSHYIAYPFEGERIKNYRKEPFVLNQIEGIMHVGIGCDIRLTELLYLTLQPQYVFYLPSKSIYQFGDHHARFNIGVNYRL